VPDEEAMGLALEEAALATAHGDVPVGAIVLDRDGAVVARRHNERERLADPTAHAELLAVRDAAQAAGGWRLDGATVVFTATDSFFSALVMRQQSTSG
jgi:tRNA(adenine34) deaminase